MKKSILALTAAAAVAVAGTPAAFAQETAAAETQKSPVASVQEALGSKKAEGEKTTVSGSVNDVFGWNDDPNAKTPDNKPVPVTTVLKKIQDIGALFAALIAVVSGISGLVAAFEKFQNFAR